MATVTVRGTASVAATPDEAGVSLEVSDLRESPARLEAARAAAVDARAKAEAYAGALDVRLGALQRVREPRPTSAPRVLEQRLAAVAEAPAIEVEPGELQVSAAVDVTYLLEPS